jgi:serine/arginine repetitive matrix protein 1
MRKVKLEVLKPWIATRFTELNGFEDDIVSSMIVGLLEDKNNQVSGPLYSLKFTR